MLQIELVYFKWSWCASNRVSVLQIESNRWFVLQSWCAKGVWWVLIGDRVCYGGL